MRRRIALWGGLALLGLIGCSQEDSQDVTAEPVASATAAPTATMQAVIPTASASAAPPAPPALSEMPDSWGEEVRWKGTLEEQNALMLDQMAHVHGLDDAARKKLEALFAASEHVGQGNPKVAKHAASPAECRAKLTKDEVAYDDAEHLKICGHRFMAPLYDPGSEKPEDAAVCIDKFEFPNIPCVYPVTWARANEAADICKSVGKRICDAHEWEDACFGALRPVDESYNFGLIEKMKREDAIKGMRRQQNIKNHDDRRWAYGNKYSSGEGLCGTGSRKSGDCGVGWKRCGTNTFPAGMFPECKSPLGVYDQHGNAAEHMNLPLKREQLASSPDPVYGYTEMKGSWFVFDRVKAHEDHCRWRAPHWHGTKVMNPKSHRNYHLGFRCCADTGPR